MVLNKYPLWKNSLIFFIVLFSFIYSLPNFYGENPAIQISAVGNNTLSPELIQKIKSFVEKNHFPIKSLEEEKNHTILIRTNDVDVQLALKEALRFFLGDNYTVALNLASASPAWLTFLGATPMKLGLDLRGGVHFTLQVDTASVIKQYLEGTIRSIETNLRETNIRYTHLLSGQSNEIDLVFRDQENFVKALDHLPVDLPGIQDTARAKEVLGGTATLEFKMVDVDHDVRSALSGSLISGSRLYHYDSRPVILKNQIILTGNSITDASSGFGEEGRPAVNIRLGGGGEGLFHHVTAQNRGKPMAIVFVETKFATKIEEGKSVRVAYKKERVISVATIRSALPNHFQITGLSSSNESRDLSLMLRAGALPAAIDIVEERTIGPQLGAENVKLGVQALLIGMGIIMIFMVFYYGLFGFISDLAIFANLLLLIALLSVLGATLTLPGIAGIVLNVGMAVDANVLIFERIREEWRNGVSLQKSIHAGYERAFSTILDANVTTLIVSFVL